MMLLDLRQDRPGTMSLMTISAVVSTGIILAMSVTGIWGWKV